MKSHHRKWATSAVLAIAALALATGAALGFVRAGVYNIGADDPHYPMTYALLEQVRNASIKRRAAQLTPPKDLMSEARMKQGAGNYNAMCTGCHLAPGMAPTELSKGLYPAPPNLTKQTVDAAEAFWTIKHGIKASGMPAWGTSMGDEYIWSMAAFLQRLPKLDKAGYDALVATSGGHSHGGGETGKGAEHHHGEGEAGHEGMAMDMPMPGGHAHAPGTPAHDDAASAHAHAPGTPPHDDAPAPATPAHTHAPGTPPHDDAPPHVDPPGTPPHSH